MKAANLKGKSATARQHHETWERDRLDPDNYFVIPEFGAVPVPPLVEGFSDPIVTPDSRHRQLDEDLRDLVRIGRTLARRTFKSIGEARDKCDEVYELLAQQKPLTELHYAALQFDHVQRLGGLRLLPPAQRQTVIGTVAILLAKWATYGAVDRRKLEFSIKASENGKKGAAPRIRAAEKRNVKIVAVARDLGWPGTRGVPKLIADRFELTERQIASILKESRLKK